MASRVRASPGPPRGLRPVFITLCGLNKAIVIPSAAEESQNVILGPSRFHAKRTCMYSAGTFSNRFRFLGCARKDTSVNRNDAAARRWACHYVNRPWSTVGIYVRPESVLRLATSRAASSSKKALTASAAPAGLAMCGQFPSPLIVTRSAFGHSGHSTGPPAGV